MKHLSHCVLVFAHAFWLTALLLLAPSCAAERATAPSEHIALAEAASAVLPAPTITSFSPAKAVQGATVTITGTSFDASAAVQLNGMAATVTSQTATSIKATVPVGATNGTVSVTTTAGTATSATSFTVLPSAPTFSPSEGVVGTLITLTGTGFTTATGVKFGGKLSSEISVSSDTTIVATVPMGAVTGKLTVVTPGGNAVSTAVFTVGPSISSFSPAKAIVGSTVTINGLNFSADAGVTFNGTPAASVTFVSNKQLKATVPAGATTGPVSVTMPIAMALSATSFAVLPSIASFSPTQGVPGDNVVIAGSGFTGATAVKFGTASTTPWSVSDSLIVVIVPVPAVSGKLTVVTPAGSAVSADSYTVGPLITSFTPATGAVGAAVTIRGLNFEAGSAVAFNGTPSATVTPTGTTKLVAIVPVGATTGPIVVSGSTGDAVSVTSFGVLPKISGFSPASGFVGTTVTITGSGFSGATAVKLGSLATPFSLDGDGVITTVVPAGATTSKLGVTTPVGTATSATSFTLLPRPSIASFTPTTSHLPATVTLTGTGFLGTTSVAIGGIEAAFTVPSATSITATIPVAASSGKLTVTNPAGSATSSATFISLGDRCASVVCTAPDVCHDAGTCDSTTGLCSNPDKPAEEACNDGCSRACACWTSTAPLPTGGTSTTLQATMWSRRYAACAAFDPASRRIYLVGGITLTGASSEVDYFDVDAGTAGTLPYSFAVATNLNTNSCAVVDGRLWYASYTGLCALDLSDGTSACAESWLYPSYNYGPALVADGHTLYVVSNYQSTFRFDIDQALAGALAWTTLASQNYSRFDYPGAALHGGWLYAIGGSYETTAVERLFVGDPANAGSYQWELFGTLPAKTYASSFAQLGQIVYVISGQMDYVDTSALMAFDLETGGSGSAGANLNQRRLSLGGVRVDNQLYVLGGFSPEELVPLSSIERFDPPLDPSHDQDADGLQDALDADDDNDGIADDVNHCRVNGSPAPCRTYYENRDGDAVPGVDTPAFPLVNACGGAPDGYLPRPPAFDCNDDDASVYPSASEVCNGVDESCDGTIDDGVTLIFYRDADLDGYGDLGVTVAACQPPVGYVTDATDCNDGDAAVSPGATETCDGVDEDCDGQIDFDLQTDPSHCGSCGNVCSGALPACAAGRCRACPAVLPTGGTSTTLQATMWSPRYGACAAFDPASRRIYLVGGITLTGASSAVDYFDVDAGTAGTLPYSFAVATNLNTNSCAVVDGRLWYASYTGLCALDLSDGTSACAESWLYPSYNYGPALVADGHTLYVVSNLQSTFRFDIDQALAGAPAWTTLASQRYARFDYPGAALHGGWLYALGASSETTAVERLFVGDPANAGSYQWELFGTLPARTNASSFVQLGQIVYVISGQMDYVDTSALMAFDLETGGSGPAGANLNQLRWFHGGVRVDNQLYVLGGFGPEQYGGPLSSIERFDPPLDPRRDHDGDGLQDVFDDDDDNDGALDPVDYCPWEQ